MLEAKPTQRYALCDTFTVLMLWTECLPAIADLGVFGQVLENASFELQHFEFQPDTPETHAQVCDTAGRSCQRELLQHDA